MQIVRTTRWKSSAAGEVRLFQTAPARIGASGRVFRLLIALALTALAACADEKNPDAGLEELERSPYWGAEEITALLDQAPKERSDALIVAHRGELLYRGGQTTARINTHSVRKSIIAVLYGIAVEREVVALDDTLEELGFDDAETPLTAEEKRATIRDLLTSRSGIYIDASGQNWDRPERHASAPGEVFFYNNWGFNALGEILERETGRPLGALLTEWLAEPLGMEHFSARNVDYDRIDGSSVRQYVIYMSADDLMRFALLVANEGEYGGVKIVSPEWIREMTAVHSSADNDPLGKFDGNFYNGYGYLWWSRDQNGRRLICADGWGGQYIIIDPQARLVLVNRRNTGTNLLAQGWFLWRGKETNRPAIFEMFDEVKALLLRSPAISAA